MIKSSFILLFLFFNSVFFCFSGPCCFALSCLSKQGLPWNTNEKECQNMLLWIITLIPTICFPYKSWVKSWVKSPWNILSTAQLYSQLPLSPPELLEDIFLTRMVPLTSNVHFLVWGLALQQAQTIVPVVQKLTILHLPSRCRIRAILTLLPWNPSEILQEVRMQDLMFNSRDALNQELQLQPS